MKFKKSHSNKNKLIILHTIFACFPFIQSLQAVVEDIIQNLTVEEEDITLNCINKQNKFCSEKLSKINSDELVISKFDKFPLEKQYENIWTSFSQKGISADKLLDIILNTSCKEWKDGIYAINEDIIKQRNNFVKFAINKGASANYLLKLAIDKNAYARYSQCGLNVPRENDLIDIAFENKANLSDIRVDYIGRLSLESTKKLLANGFSPDKLLKLAFEIRCIKVGQIGACSTEVIDNEQINLRNNIVFMCLEKGANPQEIQGFGALPDLEISKLLLAHEKCPIDPTKFVQMVISARDSFQNITTGEYNHSDDILKLKSELLYYVFENYDIDIKKLHFLQADICKALFEKNGEGKISTNNYDPSILLKLVCSCEKQEKEKLEFINLALKKGVKIDKIKNPYILKSLEKGEIPADYSQILMLYKKIPNLPIFPFVNRDVNLTLEHFKKSHGHCVGLSFLWLYSKFVTFCNIDSKINEKWFKKTLKKINKYDNQPLSPEDQENIQLFLGFIDWIQNFNDYNESLPSSLCDIEKVIKKAKHVLNLKCELKKEFSICSFFTKDKFAAIIEKIVYDDKLVYVTYPGHATGLYKNNNKYYFYDPNDINGQYTTDSAKELAEIIFATNILADEGIINLTIIGSENTNNTKYDTTKKLLAYINKDKKIDEDSLIQILCQSIEVSKESIEYYMNHVKLEDKYAMQRITSAAIINNNVWILEKLLPDIKKNKMEYFFSADKVWDCARYGTIDSLKFLLENNVNKCQEMLNVYDNGGFTTLMIATKEGRIKTVKLLLEYGADKTIKTGNDKIAYDMIPEKCKDLKELQDLLKTSECPTF